MNSSAPHTLAYVITVSDRSAAGTRPDASGPLLAEALRDAGYEVGTTLIPDGRDSVAHALREALAVGARLILTTGGTGVGPRDHTPEATRTIIDRELPGVAEAVRAQGLAHVRTAALSRGLAGVVDPDDGRPGTFVVNLPGSTGAVRDGIEVVLPLVGHVLHQLDLGDH